VGAPDSSITRRNMNRILDLIIPEGKAAKILVVGGGTIGQGTGILYSSSRVKVVAFDVYASPFVQFIADAHRIPIGDGIFDAVVIQAVIEHVLEPEKVVEEIHRVLKANGVVYAETPFMQQVHEGAFDFMRFTDSGHRWLFRKFSLVDSGVISGPGTQLIWSIDYFVRAISRSRNMGRLTRLLFSWLRGFDRLVAMPDAISGACGVFFLGRKSDVAIGAKEMRTYYKGR
jgi:ubiquinone/menaquinone biosynthesis C-methylase UbiE